MSSAVGRGDGPTGKGASSRVDLKPIDLRETWSFTARGEFPRRKAAPEGPHHGGRIENRP